MSQHKEGNFSAPKQGFPEKITHFIEYKVRQVAAASKRYLLHIVVVEICISQVWYGTSFARHQARLMYRMACRSTNDVGRQLLV